MNVHECPPWCSIVGATVTLYQFFCILHMVNAIWKTNTCIRILAKTKTIVISLTICNGSNCHYAMNILHILKH